jgi:hypothetical protein
MNVDYGAQRCLDNIRIRPYQIWELETDTRSRYFGNVALDNKINDWLSAMVRFHLILTVNYKKRINVGSADVSSYSRRNSNVSEYNYDAMLFQ